MFKLYGSINGNNKLRWQFNNCQPVASKRERNDDFKCVYTGREAKVGNFREWSYTSLAENRPTIEKQVCLSQKFSTADPQTGASPRKVFAGPQNICFPHIIAMFLFVRKLILLYVWPIFSQ